MTDYFIQSFNIINLWGHRNIKRTFNRDVNILIGPNGSGKTTVLTLLHSILRADIPKLLDVNFELTEIKLKEFKGNSTRTVSAKVDAAKNILEFSVARKKFPLDIDAYSGRRSYRSYRDPETGNIVKRMRPQYLGIRDTTIRELFAELTALVPVVWLPVSRRLPVREGTEERYATEDSLELVDVRLQELLESLSRYHSILNAQLSERYREFERQVLSAILYNKDQDQLPLILSSIPSLLPTEVEKEQLVGAFKAAGLLNRKMQGRINDHFDEAKEVVRRLNSKNPNDSKSEDLFMLPLIRRTQTMVESARELERYRENIFAPLRRYEEAVNSFLNDKSVQVDDSGQLKITSSSSSDLNPRFLSSGEKQILILLTEALLRVDKPVVYIADEPELSLHVTWQEKLLESLVTLGGQKQIIVATHSPDIVGKFRDNIITLEEERGEES